MISKNSGTANIKWFRGFRIFKNIRRCFANSFVPIFFETDIETGIYKQVHRKFLTLTYWLYILLCIKKIKFAERPFR